MSRRTEELNFWPAVADVFLTGFTIMLVLWFMNSILFATKVQSGAGVGGIMPTPEEIRAMQERLERFDSLQDRLAQKEALAEAQARELLALEKTLEQRAEELERVRRERDASQELIASLQERLREATSQSAFVIKERDDLKTLLHSKPAVIRLEEAKGYAFPFGSDYLEPGFMKSLQEEICPKVQETLARFGPMIKGLEVIGHTDGVPVGRGKGNLDERLVRRLAGESVSLIPGSNADLGLMRAVAVRSVLRKWLDENGYRNLPVYCYSAAQTQLPGGALPPEVLKAQNDPSRRRMEIRFTGLAGSE